MRLVQIQNRMPGVMVERQRGEYKRVYFLREQFMSARLSNRMVVYLCIKTRGLVGQ